MKQIEISDDAYNAISNLHGDVSAFIEKVAAASAEEEQEVLAELQESLADYEAGRHRPVEEFAATFIAEHGLRPPS